MGDATRPWVLPLLFEITTDRTFVLLQTVISALAFLLVAAAIASTLDDRRVRVATGVFIALIGLTPRITTWDSMLITESLSVSLTIVFIAVVARRDLLRHRWASVGTGVVFVLWVFLRDAHALLGIPVAVIAAVLLVRHRHAVLAGVVVVSALLAFAASRNDRDIEAFNVTANVVYHVSFDDDRQAWMLDHGMPAASGFDEGDPFRRQDVLNDDEEFQEWARGPGLGTYMQFLATHPGFTAQAFPAVLLDVSYHPEAMVDHTFANYPDPPPEVPFAIPWPREGTIYTTALLLAALLVILWFERTGRDRRQWVPPALLALSTIPHAFLVFHGAPIELARHALVLATVLVISLWWIIAIGADELVTDRSTRDEADDSGFETTDSTMPEPAD